MTREEQIRHEAGSLADFAIAHGAPWKEYHKGFIDGAKWADDHPVQPSIPSNLDEAAEEYLKQYNESAFGNGGDDWDDDILITFKTGAEWMAGQGVKLHGRILPGPRCNLYIESDCFDRGFGGLNYKFSDSNDVDMFVQIRKK